MVFHSVVALITLGYHLLVVDMNAFEIVKSLHPVWSKIPAISRAFELFATAEWVWWLDADAIIMTPSIDLYEHLLNPASLGRLLRKGQLIKGHDKVSMKARPELTTSEVCISHAEWAKIAGR